MRPSQTARHAVRMTHATAVCWQPEERNMHARLCKMLVAASMVCATQSAFANVITDWDEQAVAVVTPMASLSGTSPYTAMRLMAMVHAAMFDAVNSIERRYRPYLVQLPAAPTTSKEAAAAAAAAAVLATVDAKTAAEIKSTLASYLAAIPDGAAKSEGIKLGEAVAVKVVEARSKTVPTLPMLIDRGPRRAFMCRLQSRCPRCGQT
jgi:hypothetical protein